MIRPSHTCFLIRRLHTLASSTVNVTLCILPPQPQPSTHKVPIFLCYPARTTHTTTVITMSTAANSYYFRRRTMGRAASPPTWACYEQIQDDYSNSDSESCSEDDDDYHEVGSRTGAHQNSSDSEEGEIVPPAAHAETVSRPHDHSGEGNDIEMDMDMDMGDDAHDSQASKDMTVDKQKSDVKGKQRAVEPEPESPRRQRKKREHVYTLRPILTIQKSQGFVWNQVRSFGVFILSTTCPDSEERIFLSHLTSRIDVSYFYLVLAKLFTSLRYCIDISTKLSWLHLELTLLEQFSHDGLRSRSRRDTSN